MSVTSKSALAAELGITRGRVSQYVSAGMPTLADGKLDREAALRWIAKKHYRRIGGDHGAARSSSARATRAAGPTCRYRHPTNATAPSSGGGSTAMASGSWCAGRRSGSGSASPLLKHGSNGYAASEQHASAVLLLNGSFASSVSPHFSHGYRRLHLARKSDAG